MAWSMPRVYTIAAGGALFVELVDHVERRAEGFLVVERHDADDRNLSAAPGVVDRIGVEKRHRAVLRLVEILLLVPARQARPQARVEVADDLLVIAAARLGVAHLAVIREVVSAFALVVGAMHLAVRGVRHHRLAGPAPLDRVVAGLTEVDERADRERHEIPDGGELLDRVAHGRLRRRKAGCETERRGQKDRPIAAPHAVSPGEPGVAQRYRANPKGGKWGRMGRLPVPPKSKAAASSDSEMRGWPPRISRSTRSGLQLADMVLPLRILYFEDLSVGMTETLAKTVSSNDVVGFAELTGDRNPIHLSEHFAAKTSFGRRIAHGLYTASLISAVLGTRLPGPGAVYVSQTLNFRAPVRIGDTVEVTVTVAELDPQRQRARLSCICVVDDEVVLDGEALVKVPSEKTAKGKRPIMKL